MTLQELEELKQRRDQGVLISREQWYSVLLWAIEVTKHHESGHNQHEDGWVFWTGGDVPVAPDVEVKFLCRGGYGGQSLAGNLDWSITNCGDDIVTYRVAR